MARGVESQALEQLGAVAWVATLGPERIDEVEERVAAHPVVQAQLPWQVPRPPAHLHRLALAIEAEHARGTGVRPDEVEQDAEGRRLARAVRSQESEDLTRLDCEVDAAEGMRRPIVFDDALKLDGGYD